jgi:hypothetical protein
MNSKKQRQLYSDFCDHVRDNCRNGPNRGLAVHGEYDVTHEYLVVNLKNVTEGNGELFNDIKAFHNTKLVISDAIDDGPQVYEARIPLDSDVRPRSKKSKKHSGDDDAPSMVELMGYLMGLLAVGLGASLTTTAQDWTFLF